MFHNVLHELLWELWHFLAELVFHHTKQNLKVVASQKSTKFIIINLFGTRGVSWEHTAQSKHIMGPFSDMLWYR